MDKNSVGDGDREEIERERNRKTNRIQRRAMKRRLHDLNRRIIPDIDRRVRREGHLWEAESARVRVLVGPDDLEYAGHGEGHVGGTAAGTVGAEAEIDVEEGGGMALEPAGLYGDGAAFEGPQGAVGGCGHAAAWEGEELVGDLAWGEGE
jgi:hypothetical protein